MNVTIAVKPAAYARLKKGRFDLMQQLGKELSFSDVLDSLMDAAGWPKGK